MLKHAVVSAFANFGISVGMPAGRDTVDEVVRLFHPTPSEHNLIRLGGEGDGGYLVPDDFEGIEAAFSPGVDDRAMFESDMLARGIPCFLADASVERAPIVHPKMQFIKKYLGVVSSGNFITLDEWVDVSAPGTGDLLLQMDIEGAEWPVLLNVSDHSLKRFRMIVVELHAMDRLLDRYGAIIIQSVMQRLLRDFAIVHVHPNNYGGAVHRGSLTIPRVLEVTLLRRDRLRESNKPLFFPHPLDRVNNDQMADIALPKQWYRS
jgi:Methyltransferase FkbM domain